MVEEEEDIAAFANFSGDADSGPAPTPVSEPESPAPVVSTPTPAAPVVQASSTPSEGRVFASPLARKVASEKGLDINSISGTGPNGRIIEVDVLNHKPSPAASQPIIGAPSISAPSVGDFEDLPVSQIRKVIADRLSLSK